MDEQPDVNNIDQSPVTPGCNECKNPVAGADDRCTACIHHRLQGLLGKFHGLRR